MSPRPRAIHSDPDILGGTPVFVGARVPRTSAGERRGLPE